MADWSQSGAWPFPGEFDGREPRQALQQRDRARREVRLFMRRLAILMVALSMLVVAGTIGFVLIEGVSPGYGFEWTLDTVTTLGSIPDPQDTGGRLLKVGLELLGIGTLFYGLATVAEFFVSGQFSGVLEERRIEKMIDSFTDHYIVCGFGRVGRRVLHGEPGHTHAGHTSRCGARSAGQPHQRHRDADRHSERAGYSGDQRAARCPGGRDYHLHRLRPERLQHARVHHDPSGEWGQHVSDCQSSRGELHANRGRHLPLGSQLQR